MSSLQHAVWKHYRGFAGLRSELDYENVGMLGPNIGMKDLRQVALLNRMADEWGLDTISLGSCIGFLMEASEKELIPEKVSWGDFEAAQKLIVDIGKGEGLGKLVFCGVRSASEIIGKGSDRWAMQVKGLEISAYNCHACPGMALSFATSPIGAHHKDAWVISWEISTDRFSYNKEKVQKVIELQRIRGGFFESADGLPASVGRGQFWSAIVPGVFRSRHGKRLSLGGLYQIGDRIYNLMRAYWIREKGTWSRQMDYPPDRWFEEPHSQGKMKGVKLDREKYDQMLSWYYELRGWDQNGVPTIDALEKTGLKGVSKELIGRNG